MCNKSDIVCMTYKLDSRKMEKWVGELAKWHIANENLLARRKRGSRLVSLKIWHVTNKDSLSERDKMGEVVW